MAREPWKIDLFFRLKFKASGKGAEAPESEPVFKKQVPVLVMMLLRWSLWVASLIALSHVFSQPLMITYITASIAKFGKALMGR